MVHCDVAIVLMERADQLRAALTPLRRQLLERLREPASATQLATELGLARQRVNYHLRALEQAGLLTVVELRQRRGCVERFVRATADSYLLDPSLLSGIVTPAAAVDVHAAESFAAESFAAESFAAESLVDTAARTVRNVTRMKAAADAAGTHLLTFTVEAEIRFGAPSDVHSFSDALVAAFAAVAERFDTPAGKPYRIVFGGHPAPAREGDNHD
jgi:DNA-binding transcriptional ArsR family regulator